MWSSVAIRGGRAATRRIAFSMATVFLLAFLASCGGVQQALQDLSAQHPSARLVDVRMTDIGLESLVLIFDVTVENPYGFDLPLLDVDYSLTAHGNNFLTGSTALEGKVSARRARTIELPVRVGLAALVHTVASTRPGDVVPYTVELGLRADVAGAQPLRFSLRHRGELPVPKPPVVRIVSVSWSETTLDNVEGELRLDVENTNEFPFTVLGLAWDLSLIDMQVASGHSRHAVTLEPAYVGTLPVAVAFSPLKLGTGLVRVLTDLNRENIDYAITGVLNVETPFGAMELPYAQSGTTRSEQSP